MQPKAIIVWFKRDLRVFDHAPLANAVHDADFVLPLFVVEPGLLATANFITAALVFCE